MCLGSRRKSQIVGTYSLQPGRQLTDTSWKFKNRKSHCGSSLPPLTADSDWRCFCEKSQILTKKNAGSFSTRHGHISPSGSLMYKRDSQRLKANNPGLGKAPSSKAEADFLAAEQRQAWSSACCKRLIDPAEAFCNVIKSNSRDPDKTYYNPFTGECNRSLHLHTRAKFFVFS